MSAIHKFKKNDNDFRWEDIESHQLTEEGINNAVKSILIGDAEGAPHFIMRYFQLAPGGHSKLEQHPQEHEVLVLNGEGIIQIGEKKHNVSAFDAVFIEGGELHQFSNPYDLPFGFVCVIPRSVQ